MKNSLKTHARLWFWLAAPALLAGCGGEDVDSDRGARRPTDDHDETPADTETAPNGIPLQVISDSGVVLFSLINEVGESRDLLIFITNDPSSAAANVHAGDSIVAGPDPLPIAPETVELVGEINVTQDGWDLGDDHEWHPEAAPNTTGFVRQVMNEPIKETLAIHGFGDHDVYMVRTEHLQLNAVIPDTPSSDSPEQTGEEGIGVSGTLDLGSDKLLDFSNQELFNEDGVVLSLSNAWLSHEPTVETSLTMQGGQVGTALFRIQERLEASLEVSLTVGGAYEKDIQTTLFASQYTLPPQFIGAVPVAETVRISVDARCHVSFSAEANLTMGVTVSQDLILGAWYEDGSWSDLSAITDPTYTANGPYATAQGTAALTCKLTPRFTLFFYDVIGPYIAVTPSADFYLMASANPLDAGLTWKLDAGISGELGVDANTSIPGVKLLQKAVGLEDAKVTLFDHHTTLAEDKL